MKSRPSSWFTNFVWQNHSSMFREAFSAMESSTSMERSHHLMAALYFGIAALEGFLNQEMKKHLGPEAVELEVYKKLRHTDFMKKVHSWPEMINGRPIEDVPNLSETLEIYNRLRGDLTHPKGIGSDPYRQLLQLSPRTVEETFAMFRVHYAQSQGSRYPYWIFGWNYLNPTKGGYEITLIHEGQFMHSLQALGFSVPAYSYPQTDRWIDMHFKSVSGYRAMKDALNSAPGCEPKTTRYPYQPKLCRSWWTKEHHVSCGAVSKKSLDELRELGDLPPKSD